MTTPRQTTVGPATPAVLPVPTVVGLGGTTRPGSCTERALAVALAAAERGGARTLRFGAARLELPMYSPGAAERTPAARQLVDALRTADGVIIACPGYHGGISGLIKNALDYTEDLRDDSRPYFDGRAVGCIVCAHGWQATASTLAALRSVVHALRGWPTPLGVTINSAETVWDESGEIVDARVEQVLALVAEQVVDFARSTGHD